MHKTRIMVRLHMRKNLWQPQHPREQMYPRRLVCGHQKLESGLVGCLHHPGTLDLLLVLHKMGGGTLHKA